MRKIIIILALLFCSFSLTACNKETRASLRELGGALLGDIITDLATPESMTQLLALDGKEARLDFVLDKAKARVDMLAVQCRGAIETGDTAVLTEWVNDTLPSLAPLLKKYSAKELLRGIEKVDPRLSATLAAAMPQALAYLADQGKISEPTLEGLVTAWGANWPEGKPHNPGGQRLVITDAEIVLFGDLLEREWKKAAPPVVSTEGEL